MHKNSLQIISSALSATPIKPPSSSLDLKDTDLYRLLSSKLDKSFQMMKIQCKDTENFGFPMKFCPPT